MNAQDTNLEAIICQLQRLTAAVTKLRQTVASKEAVDRLRRETRQDLSRLCQESTWDLSMLRQEVATKHDLLQLKSALCQRDELTKGFQIIRRSLATFRFESHREHQELARFLHEGPYEWRALGGPGVREAGRDGAGGARSEAPEQCKISKRVGGRAITLPDEKPLARAARAMIAKE